MLTAWVLLNETKLVKNHGMSATCFRVMLSLLSVGEATMMSTVPYAWIGYVVEPKMTLSSNVVE